MKNVGNKTKLLGVVVAMLLLMSFNVVYAGDLNGVGDLNQIGNETTTTTTETQVETQVSVPTPTPTTETETKKSGLPETSETKKKDTENTAKAIGDMFNNAGVDEEAIREANEFIRPFAVILNKIMAIILGVTSLLMMFVTVLDLLYMAFPPVRDLLDGGASGGQQMQGGRGSRGGGMGMRRGYGGMGGGMMGGGMMGGGMGMGMDGGMGGYGMSGGRGQQQAPGGGLSALGRWVSDEAIASCMETGGGGMAEMNGQQQGPIKSMLFSYMKKRSMFLILFGVCVVLFTSTVFTDLGIKIGMWLLGVIMGFGG